MSLSLFGESKSIFTKLIDDPSAWPAYRRNLLAELISKDPLAYRIAKDYQDPPQADEDEENEDEVKAYATSNTKLYTAIFKTIDATLHQHLDSVPEGDGVATLKALRNHFEATTPSGIRVRLSQLLSISQAPEEKLSSYFHRFFTLVNQLSAMEVVFIESVRVVILLNGLDAKYDSVKNYLLLQDDLSFEACKTKLLQSYHNQLLDGSPDSSSKVLYSNSHATRNLASAFCKYCKKPGHNIQECRKRLAKEGGVPPYLSRDKRQTETRLCHYCHQPGHLKYQCEKKKLADLRRRTHSANSMNFLEFSRLPNYSPGLNFESPFQLPNTGSGNLQHDQLWLTSDSCLSSVQEDWILDSGATDHFSHLPLEKFSNLRKFQGKVDTASGESLPITHLGDLPVIGTVKVVPNIRQNLLSVTRLADEGFSVSFTGDSCTISRKDLVITGKRDHRLYRIPARNIDDALTTSEPLNLAQCYHNVFGHPSIQRLKLLDSYYNLKIPASHYASLRPCTVCIRSKLTAAPTRHTPSTTPRPKPGNHWSADIAGPIAPQSPGGCRYLFVLADHGSDAIAAYPLKRKSDAPNALRKFLSDYSTAVRRVHVLRTDDDSVFRGKVFQEILHGNLIKHELSAPHTQHAYRAELAIRRVFTVTRALLLQSGAPPSLWVEAAVCATYLQQRCPSAANPNSMPPLSLLRNVPNPSPRTISHMHPFGCRAYYRNPAVPRSLKWQARALPGIFLGYHSNSTSYRILTANLHTVVVTRDVQFVDGEFPLLRVPSSLPTYMPAFPAAPAAALPTPVQNNNPAPSGIETPVHVPHPPTPFATPARRPESKISAPPTAPASIDNSDVKTRTLPPRAARSLANAGIRDILANQLSSEHDFALAAVASHLPPDPKTLAEAKSDPDWPEWLKGLMEEYNSLKELEVFEPADLPQGARPIPLRIVFHRKPLANGGIRYKCRCVAKGFFQKFGIDFDATFSPTINHATLRMSLALVALLNLHCIQLDIKTAFLYAPIDKPVYVDYPPLYPFPRTGSHLRLRKCLYGLKNSGRAWWQTLTDYLETIGLRPLPNEPCFFVNDKPTASNLVLLCVWVDDLILACTSAELCNHFEKLIAKRFNTRNLGFPDLLLGMRISRQSDGSILLSQQDYLRSVLSRFGVSATPRTSAVPARPDVKLWSLPVAPPAPPTKLPYRSLIGALQYLAICTRPDISYAVGVCARYLHCATDAHYKAAMLILRYLATHPDFVLRYKPSPSEPARFNLQAFCDADWAGDRTNGRSTSGYVFFLAAGPIAWRSFLQRAVALSTTESEYISLSATAQMAVFFRTLFRFMSRALPIATPISIDNLPAIMIATQNSSAFHRTRHINVRFHFVKDLVSQQAISLHHVSSADNIADIFTKALSRLLFHKFASLLLYKSGSVQE